MSTTDIDRARATGKINVETYEQTPFDQPAGGPLSSRPNGA